VGWAGREGRAKKSLVQKKLKANSQSLWTTSSGDNENSYNQGVKVSNHLSRVLFTKKERQKVQAILLDPVLTPFIFVALAFCPSGADKICGKHFLQTLGVFFCFIVHRVRKIRNEDSSRPRFFSRTLCFYYVTGSPVSPLPRSLRLSFFLSVGSQHGIAFLSFSGVDPNLIAFLALVTRFLVGFTINFFLAFLGFEYPTQSLIKPGLGLVGTNVRIQWNSVYKAFHRIRFCGNKPIGR